MTTSTSKITKRERYESIMALCDTLGTMDGFDLDGIMEFCQKEIDTLGARAEKAKERAAAKRAEGMKLLLVLRGMRLPWVKLGIV